MRNRVNWMDQLTGWLLPIAFIGPGFLNILVFVLDGHQHELFRKAVVFGIQGLALLLFIGKVYLLWQHDRKCRKLILMSASLVTFSCLLFLWAYTVGFYRSYVLEQAVTTIPYLISLSCVFVIIAAENRISPFLFTCKIYSLIISPVILYYCVRFYLPSAAYGVENLGIINYMSLAYTLQHFCVFLILEILLFWEENMQGHGWTAILRSPRVDFALFALFSAAITLSGTKGPILCLLFLGFLAAVFAKLIKYTHKKMIYLFSVTTLLSVVLFSFVLFPNYGIENRLLTFIKERDSIEVTSNEVAQATTIIGSAQTPINSENPSHSDVPLSLSMEEVIDYVISGKAQEALDQGTISQEEFETLLELKNKLYSTSTGGRKYLWTCALSEIKAAPLTGQGPLFYQQKYNTYPHNYFLEIATDFGLPVMVLIGLLGLYVFICLIKYSFFQKKVAAYTIFTLAFIPRSLVSLSLYSHSPLFQYGFCVILLMLLSRANKNNELLHDRVSTT